MCGVREYSYWLCVDVDVSLCGCGDLGPRSSHSLSADSEDDTTFLPVPTGQ